MIQENLKQRLEVLRGTLRRAVALDGLGRLIALFCACAIVGIALDYFIFRWDHPVNTAFRVIMSSGILMGVAALAYYRIYAPLSIPLSADDMAIAVEREFPQLNDSLISTVQLTRMMSDDRTVSAPMVDEVARQAHQAASALDFSSVVKFDRIKSVLYTAGASVALIAVLAAIPATHDYVFTGFARLLNPFSSAKYPVRTHVAVKGVQNEIIVPRNDPLRIVAEVSGVLPSVAYISFDHGRGYGKREPITTFRTVSKPGFGDVKEFEFEYNPVIGGFDYYIEAGDDRTLIHKVRAVDRPELQKLYVSYELPNYISETKTPEKLERSLRNVVGTKAWLRGEANKPLKSALIKLGDEPVREMELSGDKMIFVTIVPIDTSRDYEIFLNDADGLDNSRSKIRHKIFALPDALPRVSWKAPTGDLEVTPTATVALSFNAEDDWGLQKSGIKFKRFRNAAANAAAAAGGQNLPAPVAPVEPASPPVEGGFEIQGTYGKTAQKLELAHDWTLADLALQPGDVVEYLAEAYDYCSVARKASEPQVLRLRILSPEELRRKLDIEKLRLIDDLKVIIRDQENDKKQVDGIKEYLSFGNAFDNAQRGKVSEAGGLQEEVRRKTQALENAFQTLIGRYRSNGLDTPDETDRLRQIADVLATEHGQKMPDASKLIASSAMMKDEADRMAQLKNASAKQEEILTDLRALLEQMQKWAETEDLLRMTRELLLKQRGVTRLTESFKDRLGAKKPADATKEEQGQVKGLEHEQRDCANDMQALFVRMTQALAKMMDLDKWVAKNIDDAIKIAQNTDATPDNPNLASTGDQYPGIEDKMRAAQADIHGRDNEAYSFGMAMGRQKACEAALERIITVLSRRREPDKQLMKDIQDAKREIQKILEQQRDLTRLTKNLKDKASLEQSIAEAKKKLQDITQRQKEVLNQTEKLDNKPNEQASKLESALDEAKKDLENLINEETGLLKDTIETLSPVERDIALAVQELEALEIEEKKLAEESKSLGDSGIENKLREQYERVKKLREGQDAINHKAVNAAKEANAANALKVLQDPQTKLITDTRDALKAMTPVIADLGKIAKDDAPKAARAQAAARAIEQAGALAGRAPEDMSAALKSLGDGNTRDSDVALKGSSEKLAQAEDVLLKALGSAQKQFEDSVNDHANRQSDVRGNVDQIANRIAAIIRNGSAPEAKNDPKLSAAAKGAAGVMSDLENASTDMGKAADGMRRGGPSGDRATAQKGSENQKSGADKLAAARSALQKVSNELSKDQKGKLGEVGGKQTKTEAKAKALQNKLAGLTDEIEKSHAAASGAAAPKSESSNAAAKVGEAAGNMAEAAKDLNVPDAANATKNEAKAIENLENVRAKLRDLDRKVAELKNPDRRLERIQKELKEETRALARDVKGLEDQMPRSPLDPKAADNINKASNNQQNAQNALGGQNSGNNSGSKSGKQGGESGKQGGESSKQGGESGKQGGESGKQGGESGKQGGESGKQGGENENKSGDKQDDNEGGADKQTAAEEQKKAISELEKALNAINDLANKAAKEEDPRIAKALKPLQEPQSALRDQVMRLQKKLDQFKDKTPSKNAERAAQSNQSASKNQSAAAGQMGQGNQSGASSSEEQAEQDLQEALDNLEQLDRQMQQQNRNEQLFQIEQELKKMLTAQKDLLSRTQDVEKQRPAPAEPLPRRAKLMAKQVFGDQLKLADGTKVIVKKLEEAPVFQWVLQTASDDMTEAAARLDKEESGAMTQEIQDDAIRKLGELIEALRKERSKGSGGGGGGGGGGGKQPLVPPLAELKMLKIMQRDVNLKTKKVDDEIRSAPPGKKDLNKDQKDRLRRNAVKEADIARITEKIAKELENGQEAPPPGEPEEKDKN